MEKISEGIVFEGVENTNRAVCNIPSVTALSNGAVIVAYRIGETKLAAESTVQFLISNDKCQTWSEPVAPFNTMFGKTPGALYAAYPEEVEPGRILTTLFWTDRAKFGKNAHFNAETQGIVPVRTLLSESTDFGQTWSAPSKLDPSPFTCPMPVSNGIKSFPDGTLACLFEKYKDYDDKEPWDQAVVMKYSSDKGSTWPRYCIAASDPKNRIWYNDPRGTVLEDGSLLNVYFTFDSGTSEFKNVHYNLSDDGCTWPEPADTGVPGQPAQPVELPDGRIVLVTVDRHISKTISAYISSDRCKSFDTANPVVVYSHSGKTAKDDDFEDWINYDYGRPQAALLEDKTVLMVYYAGTQTKTGINWVLISDV